MSEIKITLEAGPGSYEIQDSLGHLSLKHYNSPRPFIPKAEKTTKMFLSAELNKQLSGQESPGVNTYSPNRDRLLQKSPFAFFGKEKRTMPHITSLLNRSPGPVYSYRANFPSQSISFAKARRQSTVEPISPAPWDYNPQISPNKIPAVIFKSSYEKSSDKLLTPGPGSYCIKALSSVKGAYVSKVGRNIVNKKDSLPGPGSYESSRIRNIANVSFGSDKRSMDPRVCNV